MKITREIPDGPAQDRRFVAIIMLDGHGRPEQLKREFRKALTTLLHNEFGRAATITSLTEASYDSRATAKDSLLSDDPVVVADHTDDPMVED